MALDSRRLYWPASPTIHRGLEWPQFLNSLFSDCLFSVCLSVGKFSNFVVQYKAAVVRITDLFIIVQYSTVHYSTVQYSTIQYSTVQYITVQYSI